MKKFLLYFLVLSVANTLFAQYNGVGYYRVQNKVTERYIRVIDNKGSVNLSTTDADLGALETKKKFENVVSDPASIIYISPAGDGYNFKAQGTSSYSIIGYYVKLYKNSDGSYKAYAEHNGLTKYLCDENTTYNEGVVLTNSTKTRDWYIKPVNQTEGQYFAFKPSVTVGSEHYTTIYADFPFTLPAGMTAYYVTTVDGAQAVWKEVKDGKVPASTAVYVKCKSANYVDNKVSVGDNGATSLSGNLMKGVYFNNGTKKHNNQLAYNPNTMRVFGVMSDGKLGFVTANIDFIPANTAYLVVPANSPSEIKLISESDYKPYVAVQSVSLSQSKLTMYAGDSHTLAATVLPSNATDKSLKWSSSNSSVATVDANGLVKAVGYGKATITVACASNSALKATCEVNVYARCTGVQISATTQQLYVGDSFMLTANTLPLSTTDGKIEWSVSDENVVKRSADGTVTAVGAGTAEVIAKSVDGGHIAKCTVTVKVYVLPESVTLNKQSLTMYSGDTFNLVATVLPDDVIDNSIEWSSSDNNVVTVNSDGFVKAVGYGKAIVTATCVVKNTVKADCEVTVYEHCTGVELSATNAELLVGKSFKLTANTLPLAQSDGLIEWSVSDETIISRNADGVVVALAEGMAEVIAKSVDGGHIAKCKVTVKTIPVAEKIILSENSLTMYAGDKYTVTAEVLPEDAENKALTWHSSSEAVATVADGNITAVGYGKANVIAHITTNNAVADTCSVIVYEHATGVELSESDLQLYVGDSFALTANTLPLGKSDNLIEWSISDETVISRNADGDIVALAEGVAEVSAKALDGGHIAKCRVTVTVPVAEEVMLSDNSLVMYVGDSYTLTAEVLPHNAVNKALTWLSSNEVVVGVDEGEVTAKSYGNADIIVSVAQYTRNSVVSDTCSVMVYEHTAGVEISATDVEMNIGETIVLTANTLPIATTDGALEWSVSDESVLSRDDDGTIVALAEGVAEVTATSVDGGYTAKCTILVRSSTGIEDLFHESNACRIYNLHGVQFDRLQRGVNVVIFEDGTSKKVIVE